MEAKIYHRVGEKGFWIDRKYVGRLVAFKEWPKPDTEPEVIEDADTLGELRGKMSDGFWERDKAGRRTPFSCAICRIF